MDGNTGRSLGVASLAINAAHAESKSNSCFADGENEHSTLHGTIVQSVTLEKNDGTGEPAHHKFRAIALDKPICFGFDPSSTDPKAGEWASLVKADRVPAKWLGHHVTVIGDLVLDEDLSITVERITDTGVGK
jgi:hypothetical protein